MNETTAERGLGADLARARSALETDRETVAPGAAWGWAAAGIGFAALASVLLLTLDAGTRPAAAEDLPSAAVEARLSDPFEVARPEPAAARDASTPAAAPEREAAPEPVRAAAAAPAKPLVAVVIDDVGLDRAAADRVIGLPAPVTVSLLPYAAAAADVDAAARAAGFETYVHLPMEPVGLADPGPGALATWMDAATLDARIAAAFDAVPGASGVNNHMGSRFTACDACLAPVLAAAESRGLAVLDSLTGPDSRFAVDAERAGLSALSRDVFLDHDPEPAAIAARLAEAEAIARDRGWAVVIGHPKDATLSALETWIPEARARGIDVGPASAAFARAAARGEIQG